MATIIKHSPVAWEVTGGDVVEGKITYFVQNVNSIIGVFKESSFVDQYEAHKNAMMSANSPELFKAMEKLYAIVLQPDRYPTAARLEACQEAKALIDKITKL